MRMCSGSSVAMPEPVAPAAGMSMPDQTAITMQRLTIWKDELVAWFKTLVSAAVYATLIVTFGFQVARVEDEVAGDDAPTFEEMTEIVARGLDECLTEAFIIATDDCDGVFLSVDIDVCDRHGNVCVQMEGFSARVAENAASFDSAFYARLLERIVSGEVSAMDAAELG